MGSNLFIPSNEPFQRGVQGIQNALMTRSHLKTAGLQQNALGMQNQQMSEGMQKRAQLEALLQSTPEPQRERVGYEWLKANDPEKAAQLSATYVKRFMDKGHADPINAAKELENATGEKIELGKAYAKFPTERGAEIYGHLLTGQIVQPSSAKELAQIREDIANAQIEGRRDLEILKAGLKPEKTDTNLSAVELFNQDPQKFGAMREIEEKMRAKYRSPARPSASQEFQAKRLRKSIKDKKDKALATLEREYRSPMAFGRFDQMSDEELMNRKQQIQDDFENDLSSAGFESTPFSYSGPLRPSRSAPGAPTTGSISREQAFEELRRRGVIR